MINAGHNIRRLLAIKLDVSSFHLFTIWACKQVISVGKQVEISSSLPDNETPDTNKKSIRARR